MKKILCLIITMFLVYSCSNPVNEPVQPVQPVEQEQSTGSVSITLPGGSRSYSVSPSSFTIQLVNSELGYDNTITANPGDTVSINSLKPGDYTVSIKGLDSENKEIMSGNTIVTVEVAKVANAQISLQYTSGGINVEIDLPALIEEPSQEPQRFKQEGNGLYTYDENGFVSRIDVKDQRGGDYHIIYTIESGKRTGSKLYKKAESGYELSETSVITHDELGREINNTTSNTEGKNIRVTTVEFEDVSNTKKVTIQGINYYSETQELEIKSIETFDSKGRLIEFSNRGVMGAYEWLNIFGDWGSTYKDNFFKRKLAYKGDTWLLEKEEIYLDDNLLTTTTFVTKDPGFYVYAEVRNKDGFLLQPIYFSPLFEINGKFGQSINTTYIPGWANIPYNDKDSRTTISLIYSRDLQLIHNADWQLVYEEGPRRYDIIEFKQL